MSESKQAQHLVIGDTKFPARQIEVNDRLMLVPRGVARNYKSNSWQIKIARKGQVLISGSVSDAGVDPAESLAAVIRRIESELGQLKKVGKAVKLVNRNDAQCKHAQPIMLSDRVKLHWKVVDATPFMYCSVYSPLVGKTKSVTIGSDRKVAADQELLISRIATALVIESRINRDDPDPYREVSEGELLIMRDEAMRVSVLNDDVADFIAKGTVLRENALQARSKANGGLVSKLASQALSRAKLNA